jgi:3-hydroxyisobutyrate dehydrogenase-like beta-hydroxyacid dehydrogenase
LGHEQERRAPRRHHRARQDGQSDGPPPRKAGFDVSAHDIDARARGEAERAGIAVAADPRAVGERSDFVIIVVGFDKEAEAVLLGPDGIAGAARAGLIVAVASTVAPRTMARLAARLAGSGIVLLDMPLTRGEQAAEAGEMLVMVGGDADAFAACKPALASFAGAVFHLGELGAGQVGKMVNNMILWSCISANFEGFKLAQCLGVDRERLYGAVRRSRPFSVEKRLPSPTPTASAVSQG